MSEQKMFRWKRDEFSKELNKTVNEYFRSRDISTRGNKSLWFKGLFFALLYFVPFAFTFSDGLGVLPYLGLWVTMGVGMAGIGMNIMHDANHGAFSHNDRINNILGNSIYFICGNTLTWKIQHNLLHHTFTNIHGRDEDVDTGGAIRLHSEDEHRDYQTRQKWYAPFLYGIMTLNWAFFKDVRQLIRYREQGLMKRFKRNFGREIVILVFTKTIYLGAFLVLPIIIHPQAWWIAVLGFVIMHFIAGFLLSFIFQLAHVVSDVKQMGDSSESDYSWAAHQLHTTANFAMKSPFLTWFTGGLNHQIEHHLFPHISHVHYPSIAPMVKDKAKEYGLPYHEHRFFRDAVADHLRMLDLLGQKKVAG